MALNWHTTVCQSYTNGHHLYGDAFALQIIIESKGKAFKG